MKGNFLEQILQAQLPAHEIIQRGKFASLDLGQALLCGGYGISENGKISLSIEEEFYLQEQILETIFRIF